MKIPLRSLLNSAHYACYLLYVSPRLEERTQRGTQEFPCFLHWSKGGSELLWGAIYSIVSYFLELVFELKPPPLESLPLIPGVLEEDYVCGRT